MVQLKDLFVMASLASTASAQNAGDWGATDPYDNPSNWGNSTVTPGFEYTDVTLHVHSHTPIEEYALPDSDFSNRRRDGCIGVSPLLMRSGWPSEPWLFISNDINDCAIVDITVHDRSLGTYDILVKRRVDYGETPTGYISTRGETIDQRSSQSCYLSATMERISQWYMNEYDHGFLIEQANNVNINNGVADVDSIGWFLLAGMDTDGWYDEYRTDLLLHGGQNGQRKL